MNYDPTAFWERDDLDGHFKSVVEFEPTRKEERAILGFLVLCFEETCGYSIEDATLEERVGIWRRFLVIRKTALLQMSIDPASMREIAGKADSVAHNEHKQN